MEDRQGAGNNGYIFDTTGRQLLTFDAGSYVAEVLVQAGQIVISYFDQGLGSSKPSNDGIAVFNLAGQQLFGINSSGAASIMDCYALCTLGKDRILAYTYTNFPLLELRLTDYRIAQQPTPADFRGSHALTTMRGDVIFHGSYEDNTSFFWWNRKEKAQLLRSFTHRRIARYRQR
ncbi:hypothetical protein [Hymenobacter lucidus]|uniref:BPP domain-containing protein n=1 Tax=Hymenobacter lucidus TaxID=2880930 RepID=A0ABS8AK79_9BACT|nr:hypothetical protein [Hymenobacter lucidus]MCB2406453.1 hypothetical protein [Hymenobacter lucidus]